MRRQDMTQAEAEQILDLPERYGKSDLRKRFMQLAQEYHPDNAVRNGISAELAQQRMTKANKAYALLKPLFEHDPHALIHRDLVGGEQGKHGVGVHHSPTGNSAVKTQVDDSLFWDENGNPRSAVAESEANAAVDAPGHGLRRFLLGPVFLRLLFVGLLALVWWLSSPLVGPNASRFNMGIDASLDSWASVVVSTVYPSYFLLYELFLGNISGTVRELVNGLVSNATHVHVEIRKKGSYQSSLSALIERQAYGILELPLAFWLLVRGLASSDATWHMAFLVMVALLVIDALVGLFGGGVVNGIAHRLSAAIERRYMTLRRDMLKRCGQWASAKHAR